MKNKKTPDIRFKGFTDDWEQRKFGDCATRESLIQESSSTFPSVEYEDVIGEEGRLNKDICQKDKGKKGIMFDGTQILYGKLRPYLHNWLNPDFSGVAVGDWWVLKPCRIDKNFLFRIIQTKKFDSVANQSAGSKMPRADWNLISNSEFFIPKSKQEQQKVGEYFQNIDNHITLHQRKLEKLKNFKKAMLEKMFPKNGKKTPEIRFQGFTDDWEQRKLGDEAIEIVAGGDIDKSKLVDNGKYPVFANALTDEGIVGYYAEDYRIKAPAVTVTGRGDVGRVQARKVNFTPVVRLLSVTTEHDVDFLAEAINQNDIVLEFTGVPQLTVPKLAAYRIFFPSTLDEEKKIGNFFLLIDNLITLHQRKLEKLQQIKKAMLEKMFV